MKDEKLLQFLEGERGQFHIVLQKGQQVEWARSQGSFESDNFYLW